MSSLGLFEPISAASRAIPATAGRHIHHHAHPALPQDGHRSMTVAALAAWLAPFVGEGDGRRYVVPDATLFAEQASALGIRNDGDLFGGVVPSCVFAGKAISHGLADADDAVPDGWSDDFAVAVRDHTLPGLTAFSPNAARAAGLILLEQGPVRLKEAWADGGHGQAIVDTAVALDAAIERLDVAQLSRCGLVIELDLKDPITFSVGRFHVGGHTLAYVGTQSVTRDSSGRSAYGGSRLMVVKGDFAALADAELSPALRRAIAQAQAYDAAADRHIDGFFASRRNYDVVMGRAADGEVLSGVLESSWRIGGASGAEIAALRAFAANPEAGVIIASCHEVYGMKAELPKEADVYYAADDSEVGYLTKYALIES